jgi:TPP-dependent pyruvate/acetoin dehydrogenase alpha subunit
VFPSRLPDSLRGFAEPFILHRRETKKKTLEEIAAAFGDRVVLVDENDVAAETAVMGDKLGAVEVERSENSPTVTKV